MHRKVKTPTCLWCNFSQQQNFSLLLRSKTNPTSGSMNAPPPIEICQKKCHWLYEVCSGCVSCVVCSFGGKAFLPAVTTPLTLALSTRATQEEGEKERGREKERDANDKWVKKKNPRSACVYKSKSIFKSVWRERVCPCRRCRERVCVCVCV